MMQELLEAIAVDASDIQNTTLQIRGASPNGLEVQLLNVAASRGIVATIIHFKAGASVLAHYHQGGSEAHYVLEGDLVDAGRTFGPGSYLTHAANIVHGPHSSVAGCRVLTVRSSEFDVDDHHLVQQSGNALDDSSGEQLRPAQAHQADAPSSDKSAATADNPTDPHTG